MKIDYLMKCAKYKYKTLLDKGKQEAPTAQEEQIIAMRAEINNIKTHNTRGGAEYKRQDKVNTKPSTCKHSQTKGKTKVKKEFSWQAVPPTVSQPTTKTKWYKDYQWCSVVSETPGKGCNRWVVHNPSEYKGYSKKIPERGEKNSKPKLSKSKRKHSLQVNYATVALKR